MKWLKLKWKNLKIKSKVTLKFFTLLSTNGNLELTDCFIIAQWGVKNHGTGYVRSLNKLLALLIAQLAIIKNDNKRKNISNQLYLNWVTNALESCLKRNRSNVDFYEKYHVRTSKKKRIVKKRI
jgi:hypothetical protein